MIGDTTKNSEMFYIYTHTNEILLSYDKSRIDLYVGGLIYNEHRELPASTLVIPVVDLHLRNGSIIGHGSVMKATPFVKVCSKKTALSNWKEGGVRFITCKSSILDSVMLLDVEKADMSVVIMGFDESRKMLFTIKKYYKDVTKTFIDTQTQFLNGKKPRLR